jgi:hypothetical protein
LAIQKTLFLVRFRLQQDLPGIRKGFARKQGIALLDVPHKDGFEIGEEELRWTCWIGHF